MGNVMYNTKAITNFSIETDELVMTLVYIPYQRAFQKTWWGGEKLILINPCWIYEENAHFFTDRVSPKHLNILNYAIQEQEVVFDLSNISEKVKEIASDKMSREGYSIENSDFHKWFMSHYDTDSFYYKTITDALGGVKKIEIYSKGKILIGCNGEDGYHLVFTKHIPNEINACELYKKIGKCIIEYPFLIGTEDGNISFMKLDEHNDWETYDIVC